VHTAMANVVVGTMLSITLAALTPILYYIPRVRMRRRRRRKKREKMIKTKNRMMVLMMIG
jgi:hypothetical protein